MTVRLPPVVAAALLSAASCASAPETGPRPPEPGVADAAAPRTPAALPAPAPRPPAFGGGPERLPPPPSVAGPGGELLRVAGRTVTTADLGDYVLRFHPGVVGPALERLARTAIVESEAAREGVSVDATVVEAAASRAVDDRLRRLRLEFGAGADPAESLRRTTGRTVAELRDDLVRAIRTDLLRERLARLDALRRDGIELRVLVAADERTALAVAAQWRDGADAGLLATRLGLRPPEAPAAVHPSDVPDPALRARMEAAAPGTVLDPVAFESDEHESAEGRTGWQVFKVVRTWKGTAEPWAALAPRVEAWLREAPPAEDELAAWEARAARRAGLASWDRLKGFGPSPPPGTMSPR